MIYEFICKECKKKKEIDVPVSEKYTPNCCNKPMARVYRVNMNIDNLKDR